MYRRPDPGPPPTLEEVLAVAKRAGDIFRNNGLSYCLTGGTACRVWGTTRTPNDVDVVVMTTRAQEDMKRLLCDADSSFFRVPSTNPRNTYTVLWCHTSERRTRCKVDILIPPTLNIPSIPADKIVKTRESRIKVMPWSPLLLLKLQSWDDHRSSRYLDKRMKQHTDANDIRELLGIVLRKGMKWQSEAWLPSHFRSSGERRVGSFILSFPDTKQSWRELGFEGTGSSLTLSMAALRI
ncbi:hypothetical protein BC834DRAFT_133836 [Gloeopeniophorella convolvens]|nr:hypothetical protein BC834DRAFT_133836 [Gloeopeniophorella convolvens]